MKKILVLLMITVLITGLVGCSNGSQLVGKWKNTDMEAYYQFESNGEGVLAFFGVELTFEYEDDGKQITVTMTGEEAEMLKADGDSIVDVLSYEINDNELNIMGTVFTKVE